MNLIIYVYQFRDVYFGRHLARSDNTIFLADYINFYNTIHALLISIKQHNSQTQFMFYSSQSNNLILFNYTFTA